MKKIEKLGLNLNITILHFMSTHAPAERKDEVDKEEFYSSVEKVCDAVLWRRYVLQFCGEGM